MQAYPQTPQVSVGAIIIHQGKALMIQRGQEPSRGLWSIPGGCVKLGETLQQALLREVSEETGLTVAVSKLVYHCDIIERDPTNRVRFHYVVLDYRAEYLHGTTQAASDVAATRWVDSRELEQLQCVPLIADLVAKELST